MSAAVKTLLLMLYISALFANKRVYINVGRTLLYELVSGEFPWRGLRAEETMWLVMNAERQSLASLGCNSVLKVIDDRHSR